VKVVVLTTSYPRGPDDVAGLFVHGSVEAARAAGVEVEVVSPAGLRHFGIAYGHGVVGNLRRRPWLALLLPAFLAAFAAAARRAARDADLVHAHWLPSALVARATRRPYVVQLWGTDVELARRAPWLARPLLRRARAVVVASDFLAAAARELGARAVHVVPSPVEVPESVEDPEEPPHVLFVGRLSPEKGIQEFLAATEGLPRVVVGAGPVAVPESVGSVPHDRLGAYYARAAVVCVPSRREGYGMVAREALAYGRAVVATRVGGLADAIEDGVTGLLVPPGEPAALRRALELVLADAALRERLGTAAREAAALASSREAAGAGLAEAYAAARAGRPDVLVLCYHAVDGGDSALSTSPEVLDRHLRHLRAGGYAGVTFSEAVRGAGARRVAAITFDDGFENVATTALPLLARQGFVGTLFVPPATVGLPGVVTWEQLRALAGAGWEIGAHGWDHVDLTTLGDEALQDQLRRARSILEERLGTSCRSLALPYGRGGARELAAARAAGFDAVASLGLRSQPGAVGRVGVSSRDGRLGFRLKISPHLRAIRRSRLAALERPVRAARQAARRAA
jgi:glycosyltransferase involved in cell wall biosynthesis/peptidoglycan/xylan/chitin deacetylase (PgdA/CDA1 family)